MKQQTSFAFPNNSEWVTKPASLISERERAIYELGKEQGADEYKKGLNDLLFKNLSKSYNDTSKVIELLKENEIDVISARLKVESFNCLKVLLSVPEEKAKPDKMEAIYNFLFKLEEQVNTGDYSVDFSILKANKGFSDSCVEGDGYIYKHRLAIHEA